MFCFLAKKTKKRGSPVAQISFKFWSEISLMSTGYIVFSMYDFKIKMDFGRLRGSRHTHVQFFISLYWSWLNVSYPIQLSSICPLDQNSQKMGSTYRIPLIQKHLNWPSWPWQYSGIKKWCIGSLLYISGVNEIITSNIFFALLYE